MSDSRILALHLRRILRRLIDFVEHTARAKHPDVKGLTREGFVKIFLKENLPSLVEYKTGEILDQNDDRSGQLDIILQSALSPRINLYDDIQITLADFVLAVIEVKSTLTTGEKDSGLHSALETIRKVKKLKRTHQVRYLSPELNEEWEHPNTPCVLFAYNGPTIKTMVDKLQELYRN